MHSSTKVHQGYNNPTKNMSMQCYSVANSCSCGTDDFMIPQQKLDCLKFLFCWPWLVVLIMYVDLTAVQVGPMQLLMTFIIITYILARREALNNNTDVSGVSK